MEVMQYPPVNEQWVLNPFNMLLEHEIEYEVSIISQFTKEQDWCEVSITVKKEYEDYDDGVIFNGSVTSGFKIKSKRREISPDILFDLLKIAGLNFAKAFAELVKRTSLEGTKIAKPEFGFYERYLNRVIESANLKQ